jgi:hypothetical protein
VSPNAAGEKPNGERDRDDERQRIRSYPLFERAELRPQIRRRRIHDLRRLVFHGIAHALLHVDPARELVERPCDRSAVARY